jgi:hypothetical protein
LELELKLLGIRTCNSQMATKTNRREAGKLLKLLRKVGFKDELPPSTANWLDTHPMFQWVGDHLSEENFVSPVIQAKYDEIQLLDHGPLHVQDHGLASAMGLSDSSSDSGDELSPGEADSLELLKAKVEVSFFVKAVTYMELLPGDHT